MAARLAKSPPDLRGDCTRLAKVGVAARSSPLNSEARSILSTTWNGNGTLTGSPWIGIEAHLALLSLNSIIYS